MKTCFSHACRANIVRFYIIKEVVVFLLYNCLCFDFGEEQACEISEYGS